MRFIALLSGFLLIGNISVGQVGLTLQQCEDLFRQNNLNILAGQLGIEAARAELVQAKIWEQPIFSWDGNLLNPSAGRVFDLGTQGQKTMSVEQLIYLGGKKKSEIEFAKSHVAYAETQLEQLLRNLRFQLRQNFFAAYFTREKIREMNAILSTLDTLLIAFTDQAARGNISQKELTRLQALNLSLKTEVAELRKKEFAHLATVKALTHFPENFQPVTDISSIERRLSDPISASDQYIYETLWRRNPDFLNAIQLIERERLFMEWQKSLAVPDIISGLNYDQRGGAFNNQINIGIKIPLPLWNKNLGNIQRADAQLKQSIYSKDQLKIELKTQVDLLLQTLQLQKQQFREVAINMQDLQSIYLSLLENFQKRNISLIEFTDFLESYSKSLILLQQIKEDGILAGEGLNALLLEEIF